jgi:TRAP transporter TAXI family solute receptor
MNTLLSRTVALIACLPLAACGGVADPDIGSGDQATEDGERPTVSANLTWATTAASSTNYAYAVAVAQELQRGLPNVRINVIESAGTPDNLARMEGGSAQLVNITSDGALQAYEGIGAYADSQSEDLRVLWYFQDSPYHFIVRARSGISKVSELEGESFNPGISGSSTEQTVLQVLKTLGISPDYSRGGLDDAVNSFKDRRITGLVKAGPVPEPLMSELSISADLGLAGFTEEQIQTVGHEMPYLEFSTIPGGTYPGIAEEIQTLSLVLGVGAGKDVSTEVAYEITKGMWEKNDRIADSHATLKGVDIPKLTVEKAKTPLHCGAVQYYEEDLEMTVPDELLPPEEC